MPPMSEDHTPHETTRIDGRLHEMQPIRDETGRVIGTAPRALNVEMHIEDYFQLLGGAGVISIPLAMTEEVWNLGAGISNARALVIALVTIVSLAIYVWALFYRHRVSLYRGEMVKRVIAAYAIALATSVGLLLLIDKAPADDIALTLRRAVLVAWPATLSATTIDWLK